MANFTTLTGSKTTPGSIKEAINHSGIPVTQILSDAEAWIYQRLRVREMLASTTGTLAAASDTISLSSLTGYKSPFFLMFTGTAFTPKFVPERRSLDFVLRSWGYDGDGVRSVGRPYCWASDATTIQFDTIADTAYPYLLRYYRALPALAADNETNFLTDSYPRLLRAVCYAFANEWKKDEREKAYWFQVAEKEPLRQQWFASSWSKQS